MSEPLLHGGATVLVVVGLFATAMIAWTISNRPTWWRVRTELYGFLWFAAALMLFFSFNFCLHSVTCPVHGFSYSF